MAVFLLIFFFKQKTAYEMRISDWSSDVCSSDLRLWLRLWRRPVGGLQQRGLLRSLLRLWLWGLWLAFLLWLVQRFLLPGHRLLYLRPPGQPPPLERPPSPLLGGPPGPLARRPARALGRFPSCSHGCQARLPPGRHRPGRIPPASPPKPTHIPARKAT